MAKTFTGIVSSDKTDKTIVVTVRTRKTHPIYKKKYPSSKKFMAHDETNEAKLGDKVSIIETKPLSKRKRFALDKILEKAPIRHVEDETSAAGNQPSQKVQGAGNGKQNTTVPKEAL